MNIQAEKLGLIEWIARLTDMVILERLVRIRDEYDSKDTDWWDTISSDEKQSIERGIKDIHEGKVHTHESVKKIYEKYL